MAKSETASPDKRFVFTCGETVFTVRDLIDSSLFRGELQPVWQNLLRMIEAERMADERELEMDDDPIDAAAEMFRYQHDLITAEETEQWLEQRGLTLSDFSAYFVRHYWGDLLGDEVEPAERDYFSAADEFRELLVAELIFSGELDQLANRLSRRVAGRAASRGTEIDAAAIAEARSDFFKRHEMKENDLPAWLCRTGRDLDWWSESVAMEAAHRQRRDGLLTQHAREREIAALRLPLTRFEVETIEFDSTDAAREAALCVREDGMSMEEVAAEGRYPYRHTELLLEDIPEDLQQKFLSVSPGEMLEPIPHGDGFHLCRVAGKVEPNVDDPVVKNRAELRILDRHFAELTANHIQWRNLAHSAT